MEIAKSRFIINNGTVQDWNENVSVYNEKGTKRQPVIDDKQVICTDGIIK